MQSDHNVRVVSEAYERFKRGDIGALLELCTDDVQWELNALEGIAFTGRRSGKPAVAEFFRLMASLQEAIEFEPREFVAQNDKVAVVGHYAWKVKATGMVFVSDWVQIFILRDARIAGFRDYSDSAAQARAYGHAAPR